MRLRQRAAVPNFHTLPALPDVGADFECDEFAVALADAHVDFVTPCARCSLGTVYEPTEGGVTQLSRQRYLLGGMVEAPRRPHGIAPMIPQRTDQRTESLKQDWRQQNAQLQ